MSLHHYESHADAYFNATVGLPPPKILTSLIKRLAPGSTILDLGCGSGRDLAYLASLGFRAIGIEHSPSLAALARDHSKCEVIVDDFRTHHFPKRYHGVVSLGSFVHAAPSELGALLSLMRSLLAPHGFGVISLKKGSGSTSDGTRTFTLWKDPELRDLFIMTELAVVTSEETVSSLNGSDVWLSYLVQDFRDLNSR